MYTLRERINNQSNINIVEWDRQFLQIFKGSESFAKLREKVRTGSNKTGIWGSGHKYKWFCEVFATFLCIEEETKKNTKRKVSLLKHMFEENLLVISVGVCLLMNCAFHLVTVVQLLSYVCLYDSMDCSMPGFPVLHYPWSLLKFMSIESVMPSNHLILCHQLFLLSSIIPNITIFSSEAALCIRWPKYWHSSVSVLTMII